MSDTTTDEGLREQIREHYAERAVAAGQAQPCSCGCSCGPAAAVEPQDEFARGLYAVDETEDLPAEAVLASLGCGNPTALADLRPARSCSTSAAAAASTCSCRLVASALPARPTAST